MKDSNAQKPTSETYFSAMYGNICEVLQGSMQRQLQGEGDIHLQQSNKD